MSCRLTHLIPRSLPCTLFLGLLSLGLGGAGAVSAAEPARLAPATSLAYIEIRSPDALYDRAMAPALWEKLRKLAAVDAYLSSPQYATVRFVVGLLEARLGVDWEKALRESTGGGIAASFDPASESVLFVVKARSPELLGKLNAALLEMAEADARNKSQPSSIKTSQYQGVTVWQTNDQGFYALVDDVLVASNKESGLHAALDRVRDKTARSLADEPMFDQARRQAGEAAVAWSWTRLDMVRNLPNVAKVLGLPSDNPLLELLAGGVLESAQNAPYVVGSLDLRDDDVKLRLTMPHDGAKATPARKWFFTTPSEAPTAPIELPGNIATLVIDRDLAGYWTGRDELFNDQIKAGFAQADSQFGLFFAGRDFGPEVLGELNPRWQLVVARQEFETGRPLPALKLPAFALVLELKHPDEFGEQLLVGYQTIVGLLNVTGAQNAQPQFLAASEQRGDVTISKSTFVVRKGTDLAKAPINYNFGPSCAQVGKHFIVGSTLGITRQLVDALAHAPPAAAPENASLTLNVGELAVAVAENRELLVNQNMLQAGRTRAESEAYIDAVFALAKLAVDSRIGMQVDASEISFEWRVKTAPELRPAAK